MTTDNTTPTNDIVASIVEVAMKKSSLDTFCSQFGFDDFVSNITKADLDLKTASAIVSNYLSKVTEVIISSRTITQRPREDMQAYFSIDEYSDMFVDYRMECVDFHTNPGDRTLKDFETFCLKVKKDLDVLRHLLLKADVILRV